MGKEKDAGDKAATPTAGKKDEGRPAAAAAETKTSSTAVTVTAAGFRVGEDVSVWSASKEIWIEDGEITDATVEDGIIVLYNEGEFSKEIPLDQAPKLLKKRGKQKDIVGTEYCIGEKIGVWSESNQKYIEDGELTGASAE